MRDVGSEVRQRAGRIKLVLLDVDGVLTDGGLHMASKGYDGRVFHSRDGLGIRMGQRGGLQFGIISGRDCEVVTRRAEELSIAEVHQGVHDKIGRMEQIQARLGVGDDEVCFVGDDLPDLPVMRRSGLAAAPADAVPEVRQAAHYVTECDGGRGAVREIVDLLLRASGNWDRVIERYY